LHQQAHEKTPPIKFRVSGTYLDMRRKQEVTRQQKRYEEAWRIKTAADKLHEEEVEAWN